MDENSKIEISHEAKITLVKFILGGKDSIAKGASLQIEKNGVECRCGGGAMFKGGGPWILKILKIFIIILMFSNFSL